MTRLEQQIDACLNLSASTSGLYEEGYASIHIAHIIEECFKGNQ